MYQEDESVLYHSQNNLQTYAHSESTRQRKIWDPIHNLIYFDQPIWDIIDTPVFQRLRQIKQLGTTSYVFSGANHTRFEHSLGVGYLAQYFAKSITKRQQDLFEDPKERDENIKLITIAGLIHDLGHGPFSHMFDGILIPKITGKADGWNHEKGSADLFQYLCSEYKLGLEKSQIDKIINMIHGSRPEGFQGKWMLDIVSNSRNGIDVDKFDYIRRDTHHLGWTNYLKDYRLLIKEAKVIEDKICFPLKYAMNIYDIYSTRYKLYKQVYLNNVSQAIELMLCDVLLAVNEKYKFEELVHDPARYYALNDSIIERIENSKSEKQGFVKAKKIIARLRKRDLYRPVGQVLVNYDRSLVGSKIKEDITGALGTDEKESVYIQTGEIGFGSKNQNPLDVVDFFQGEKNGIIKSKAEDLSFCLPSKFSERFIRVFVSDDSIFSRVEEAFKKYCKREFNQQPTTSDQGKKHSQGTPYKAERQQQGDLTSSGKQGKSKVPTKLLDFSTPGFG